MTNGLCLTLRSVFTMVPCMVVVYVFQAARVPRFPPTPQTGHPSSKTCRTLRDGSGSELPACLTVWVKSHMLSRNGLEGSTDATDD